MGRAIPVIETGLTKDDQQKMSKGKQFIVAKFKERTREDLLRFLEEEGFSYLNNGVSREMLINSVFPIIIEVSVKKIWGIMSYAMAAASIKAHISDSEFYREYSEMCDIVLGTSRNEKRK